MSNELEIRNTEVGIVLAPEAVLENAKVAAKALVTVLSQKKKPVIMNGEQYLEYEDWLTCAQFYGYTVRTGDAEFVEIDGVKGAKAHADLIEIKTGLVIGGAEAYCMRDEEKWNTRTKYEWQGQGKDARRVKVGEEAVPWFQLASMAQTRAGAKALRNRLAWVVVLAGYKPTPAEEMTDNTVSEAVKERRTVDKSEHYCTVHNVNFFKKGRMEKYAHPIEGTKEWCSEPDTHDAAPVAQGVASSPKEVEVVTEADKVATDAPYRINLDWLKESLATLCWTSIDAGQYLTRKYTVKGKTLTEMVNKLDPEQAVEFCAEVQKRLNEQEKKG